MSTADLVAQAYQSALGRAPDQAGLDWWTNQVNSGAVSLSDLAKQLDTGRRGVDTVQPTGAAASAQQTINMATPYTSTGGVVAIPGVNDYAAKLHAAQQLSSLNGQSVESIMQTAFNNGVPVNSGDYLVGAGGVLTTPQDAITQAYSQVLGRTPDQAGMDWWTNQLKSGVISLNQLPSALETGRRGVDLRPSATPTPVPTPAPAGGGSSSSAPSTVPAYTPILSTANYGIGLQPGETTYQSPLGTIAGGATYNAPQYGSPLPAGVSNYAPVTSAPRVTQTIAELPQWVKDRVQGGPSFNAPKAYKRGGLARYADGGEVDEDITDNIVKSGLGRTDGGSYASIPVGGQAMYDDMARQAFDQRMQMLDTVRNNPALQVKQAPSEAQQIGEAMMRAGAAGPANIGQLTGRSGAAYFDAQKNLEEENQKRALQRMALEEKIVPDAKALLAAKGKNPLSPEKLNAVYTSALNVAAQVAKNERYGFKSAEEQHAWVLNKGKEAVDEYIKQYAQQPTGPRGSLNEPPLPATGTATLPAPQKPTGGAVVQPQGVFGGAAKPAAAPAQVAGLEKYGGVDVINRNLKLIDDQMKVTPVNQRPILMKEKQDMLNALAEAGVKTSSGVENKPVPAPAEPVPKSFLRNKPMEQGAVKGAETMYANYAKQYDEAQVDAAAASKELDQIHTLRNIKPNTNMFANANEMVGNLIGALGGDANSPLIKDAMKNRQSNIILDQIMNTALSAQKGTQTRTDEVRIRNEFPKTTDFNQVFNFGLNLAEERARRRTEKLKFMSSLADQSNGTPINGQAKWDETVKNDPLTQYLGGKLVFRTPFINAYMRKYKDATEQDAVNEWKSMEQDYIRRGGKK